MLNIKCFKAGKGDCFLLTWDSGGQRRLLIDSGIAGTYRFFAPLVRDFSVSDHVIMTHVDYDHIGGLFKWLNDRKEKFSSEASLYMNTPQLLITPPAGDQVGIEHGVNLEEELYNQGIEPKSMYVIPDGDNTLDLGGLILKVISPPEKVLKQLLARWTAEQIYQEYINRRAEQDNKVSIPRSKQLKTKEEILNSPPKPHKWEDDLLNASSIAFILKYKESNLLFLGDANPDLVADELANLTWSKTNRLALKLFKISHHGSKKNTTQRLLEMVDCSDYLISTDSTGPYYHPARETLILISEYGRKDNTVPITIYSNYTLAIDKLLSLEEMENITFKEIHEINIE